VNIGFEYEVVTRRIPLSRDELAGVVVDGAGCWRFDALGAAPLDGWEAHGVLPVGWARAAPMTIAIEPWSSAACELRLRPRTRRFAAWGRRRQRAWFRVAHRAADDLVHALVVAARRRDTQRWLTTRTFVELTGKVEDQWLPSAKR
jgi:hypothetical protein